MKKKIFNSRLCSTILLALGLSMSPIANAQTISTIAGTGSSGYTGDGGAATSATFDAPTGVAIDASGNIYVVDRNNEVVRKISAAGIVSTVIGNGYYGYTGDGGAATAATIGDPFGIAVDGSGNIYLADYANNCIRKVNGSGIINTIAGTGTAGYSGDGGAATAAQLNQPFGIAVDGSGNVFFSDNGNNCVREISSTGTINTIAGTGTAGYSGDGGAGTAAKLNNPYGVAVDGSGNVYIADGNNHRVRMVNSGGTINTFAGTGVYGFSGDGGAATSAQIWDPYFVWVDASNNVYISDEGNNRIRVVSSGTINTYVGTGAFGFSGDGGLATAAEIYSPAGIATDMLGNLYFADATNYRVRAVCVGVPTVAAITGTTTVCATATTTLSDATAGGTWTSSNTSIATVNTSTGVVTGVSAGTATISYTVASLCGSTFVTTSVTVNPLPDAGTITGSSTVCVGSNTTLTDAAGGGSWSSSNTSVASVNPSGVVWGVSVGTATISYSVTNSCGTAVATFSITVNPLPDAGTITGSSTVCVGSNTTLTDAAGGGSWSSSNTSVATVNSSGVVHGVSAGTATISYSVTNSCGTAVATFTITVQSPLSAPTLSYALTSTGATYTGALATFVGCNAITAVGSPTGGTFSSSDATIASIDPTTGVIVGMCSGSVHITYTISNSCGSRNVVSGNFTVSCLPGITLGSGNLCVGSNYTCSSVNGNCGLPSGGTWSSSNTAAVTVNSSTGIAYAIATGSAVISYTLPSSGGLCTACNTLAGRTTTSLGLTVYAPGSAPSAITACAGTTVHVGSTIDFTDATAGDTWSISPASIASICSTCSSNSSGSGASCYTGTENAYATVSGVSAGTATLFYQYKNSPGCPTPYQFKTITVVSPRGANGEEMSYVNSTNKYSLYPNPSDGNISITQQVSVDGKVQVRIMNAVGQSVYDGGIEFKGGESKLSLYSLSSGIYLVELKDANGERFNTKVVIEK